MEVKIYREKENESLIINENDLKEYNTLALELGLQTKENVESENCPIVYPILNEAMQRQLRALCPSSLPIDKYIRTTIPLEILKVCKFIKDNDIFDELKVWFDDKQLDPLVIGYKWPDEESKEKGYTWRMNKYLIARWGDCAKEIPELLQDGFERVKLELQEKAIVAKEKCDSVLSNLDVYTRKIVNGTNSDMHIDLRTEADSGF
jgi:hypothetical protein